MKPGDERVFVLDCSDQACGAVFRDPEDVETAGDDPARSTEGRPDE
jgi:hypothetical protein